MSSRSTPRQVALHESPNVVLSEIESLETIHGRPDDGFGLLHQLGAGGHGFADKYA
jgi:hypothetical protein